MDELLWSVQVKQGIEDRRRFLVALPDLLKRLRAGLQSVDQRDAWTPFFRHLIRLHVASIQRAVRDPQQADPGLGSAADASAASGREPSTPAETRVDPSGIATSAPADEPLPGEEAGISSGDDSPPSDRYLELARSLEVGAWLEFASSRGNRNTLRLSWVSEFKGAYLFTNRQGENALTLAATSLADHLRKGTARVLSHDRLTDRAVAALLERARLDSVPAPHEA